MKPEPVEPMWFAPRDNFSQRCCEYFACNFDNAPRFIVRSDYVKPKGSSSHQLRKHLAKVTPAQARRGRRSSKGANRQMAERAMRQTESLLGGAR